MLISYVDKIVDMRRNLVMVRSEFPHELGSPFQAMETNGNPWNLSRMDRAAWSDGLGIPTMSRASPTAPVLFWVGCAASYDDRAKKIARATAKLLKQAGVDFAILGTGGELHGRPGASRRQRVPLRDARRGQRGDPQRLQGEGRHQDGRHDVPALLQHAEERVPGLRRCKLEVVHHTDFLLGLLAERKLVPTNPVAGARRLPRQLLPRPLQRRLRLAARDPASASRASSSSSPSTGPSSAASAAARAARRCSWRSRTRTA